MQEEYNDRNKGDILGHVFATVRAHSTILDAMRTGFVDFNDIDTVFHGVIDAVRKRSSSGIPSQMFLKKTSSVYTGQKK